MFEELKRRRVFRVATLYVVAFWPIIQIVDILSPALELPDAVMKYIVIAFIAGFPIALILAWIFDINKDGVTMTQDESLESPPLIGGRSEVAIVGALLLLVVGLFIVQTQIDDGPYRLFEAASKQQSAVSNQYSVAVLPFVTFSGKPADQHFADGLTEELLNVLSRVGSLRVAARTSSFAYRGVNKNVTDIGRELNVGIILEGSVRRSDVADTIRVTAQLIETATGTHLWSKTYDRKFTDVFKIQDDIAGSVVDELQITLLGDEREKIQSRSSANPDAMVAYGLGQSDLSRRSQQSLEDATRFFNKAIELDPNYADAYVGRATAQTLLVNYGYGNAETLLPQAQQSLDQAFELEPESGAAWATQGLIHLQEKNKVAATQALEKSMAYNPSYAMAFMWYAGLQETDEDRLNWYRRAYELDPKSPVIGFNVASILLDQGRDIEAMEVYVQIVESDPNYHGAYYLAARVNESQGRVDEAINQWEKAYELSPQNGYAASIASLYIDLGNFDQSLIWLERSKDNVSEKFKPQLEWLEISAYAAANRQEETETLLRKKIARADQYDDNVHFEDATVAAYHLEQPKQVLDYFEKINGEPGQAHFYNSNRFEAMLAAAYVYRGQGNLVESENLLVRIESLIEELGKKKLNLHNQVWFLRAQVAAIRGENQMALFHLQRAIDEGWRSHWRTRVEPILVPLSQEPAFQSMIAGLETRMDIMREQLALASVFDSGWSG